jgi:surface antigen
MSPAWLVVSALVAAAVAGCANDPHSPKQDSGVVTGAASGGAPGTVGGRGTASRVAGAATGPAAGGLAGSAIGTSLDEKDRQRAYAAEMQALENGSPGAPTGWRSEHTTYHGTVVPGPYYYSGGMRCRAYSHTVYIEGRPQAMRGTACRNPDGSWAAIG